MLKTKLAELIKDEDGQTGLLVKNLKTGELIFSHNADMVFPAASIIKLPILLTLLDEAAEGRIDPGEAVPVFAGEFVEGSGLVRHLSGKPPLSWLDHALFMIAVSDNVSTNHLISRLGMELINSKISSLGMKSTVLGRKMMDFKARAQGKDNYTNCNDLLVIFEHFLGSSEKYGEALRILRQQQHNGLLAALLDNDAFEFAHKTGGLPNIRHDAGIMYLRDPIFVAFLSKEFTHEKDGLRLAHETGLEIYEEFKP